MRNALREAQPTQYDEKYDVVWELQMIELSAGALIQDASASSAPELQ